MNVLRLHPSGSPWDTHHLLSKCTESEASAAASGTGALWAYFDDIAQFRSTLLIKTCPSGNFKEFWNIYLRPF